MLDCVMSQQLGLIRIGSNEGVTAGDLECAVRREAAENVARPKRRALTPTSNELYHRRRSGSL